MSATPTVTSGPGPGLKFLPILLLVVLTGLRLWTAAAMPLTPKEAFLWMCANQLDWAFFDGPGGTACLVKGGFLCIGDDALGLRFAFPLFAALATVAAYLAGRSLFGPSGGWWSATGLNTLPAFNLSAVQASPAVPLTACLLLAAWSALEAGQRNSSLRWLAAGAFAGIGAQFSYLALLFAPGVFLACALSGHRRRLLRTAGPHLCAIVAISSVIPAVLWNQAHGWPMLGLETLRTVMTPKWSAIPGALWENVSLLSPPGALFAGIAAILLVVAARIHARPKFLTGLAAPFLAFWLWSLWHGDTSSPALLPVAAFALLGIGSAAGWIAAVGFPVLATIAAGFSAMALTQAAKSNPVPWADLARHVDALVVAEQNGRADALFVIAKDPELTAMLNYHLPRIASGQVREIFLRESQDLSNQFGLWPRYDDFVETEVAPDEMFQQHKAANPYLGRSAIYVTDEVFADLPQTITAGFVKVTPVATMRMGERVLRAYLCEEYQTVPL